jgi:hypothetical protein
MLSQIRACRPALRQFPSRPCPYRLYLGRNFTSPPPPDPKQRSRFVQRGLTVAKYSGYFCLSAVFGVLAIGTGIFVHDAFTYTNKHIDRVPVSPLALHPERGGPKDLPLISCQVDDVEDDIHKELSEKPRLVIVGCGWGVSFPVMSCVGGVLLNSRWQATGLLATLNTGDYHVTVVATETFNTFTPLLPCESLPFQRLFCLLMALIQLQQWEPFKFDP